MRRSLFALSWAAYLMVLTAGCITEIPEGPEISPLQTKILEVRVVPDPVVVGDTARFTCIIEDSLDTRFHFRWIFSGPGWSKVDRSQFHRLDCA